MDFFDPQKQKRHDLRLAVGYALMGVVLILATTVLLYRAYGFGLDKNGRIIQNGLVFVSSRPDAADAYINGAKYKDQTNTRMDLPAGQYVLELKRNGYHNWKRALTVEGGSVARFDYPLLFPTNLTTEPVKQYSAAPGLSTVSPDRRWQLVAQPGQNVFDLFDLDAEEPVSRPLTVSSDILAAGSTTTAWELVDWSKDNRHVVLKRLFDRGGQNGSEYLLFDREEPELSQNLSTLLGFTPTTLELRDGAFDQYYLFDQGSGQLFTASVRQPTPRPYLSDVLGFTAEGDTVLYATAKDAPAGQTFIRVKQNDDPSFTVRQVPTSPSYLLDMAVYERGLYVAAGVSSENRVFVYRDPIGQLKRRPGEPLVPLQILKVTAPNHLSFSANKRFVIAENADQFAVHDIETDRGYAYQVKAPMDPPQTHATWMDGFRLTYVSGGKLYVFDFDGTNLRQLSAANPAFVAGFDRDYRFLYTVDTAQVLSRTSLLTAADR